MFRFVALFALVAVALAEPEADAQFLVNPYNTVAGVPVVNTYANRLVNPAVYNQLPVVKQVVNPVVYNQVPAAVLPSVKYVDPHHTEGMTADGRVPEKTNSVKIAEKQHELAKTIEDSKAKFAYAAPYNTYAGVYPYAHQVAHIVAKREADSESDAAPYVPYNGVYGQVYPQAWGTTYGAPITTAAAGYPYTTSVSGYHYQSPVVAHKIVKPVVYNQVPVVEQEKINSGKIAEKQQELAKTIEDSKAKVAYVAPYTTYAGVYPYANQVAHVIAKREADIESDAKAYVTYKGVFGQVYPQAWGTTYGAPLTTAVAGYARPAIYNTPYTYGYNGHVAGWF